MGQAPTRTGSPTPPWRSLLRRGGVFSASRPGSGACHPPRRFPVRAWSLLALLLLTGGCADSGPSPITLNTLERWILRYSAPPPKALPAPRPPQVVFIDAEVLAHHHPDWQLADALMGATEPVPPPAAVGALAPAPGPLASLPPLAAPEAVVSGVTLRAGPNAALVRGEELRAVSDLIADAERRQSQLAGQEQDIANRELDQEIAAAQRKRLVDLEPVQLSPGDQNRLTNLRLSLLRNLSRTPAERAQSQAELDQLIQNWSAQLRQQAAEHRAEIDEVYQRIPAEMRAEGQKAMTAAAAKKQVDRLLQRETVKSEQEALIGQDLAAAELSLQARLPPAVAPGPLAAPVWPKEIRTSPGAFASPGPVPVAAGGSTGPRAPAAPGTASLVAQLRARARHEAAAWARLAALRMGVIWSRNPRYPDDTQAALAVLAAPPSQKSGVARKPDQS